jgi:hypothetical protein
VGDVLALPALERLLIEANILYGIAARALRCLQSSGGTGWQQRHDGDTEHTQDQSEASDSPVLKPFGCPIMTATMPQITQMTTMTTIICVSF